MRTFYLNQETVLREKPQKWNKQTLWCNYGTFARDGCRHTLLPFLFSSSPFFSPPPPLPFLIVNQETKFKHTSLHFLLFGEKICP